MQSNVNGGPDVNSPTLAGSPSEATNSAPVVSKSTEIDGSKPSEIEFRVAIDPETAFIRILGAETELFEKGVATAEVRMKIRALLQAVFRAYDLEFTKQIAESQQRNAANEKSAENVNKSLFKLRDNMITLVKRYERLNEAIQKKEHAIESFKQSIREDLKLAEARSLWDSAARRAKRSYTYSWIILAVLLLGGPGFAIYEYDKISNFLRIVSETVMMNIPEKATDTAILISAISRLILITMPIALYFWLIRLVVKFNSRSLLLMDDARQRNTMLETYLHLVERDADVKTDRPLILEALFRRTPGHGPETVEPVNLADILRMTNTLK